MIRITVTIEAQRRVFRIEGRFLAGDVPALDQACADHGSPQVLDLADLQSADIAGSERLRELICEDVRMRGQSPYLRLLMDGDD